MDSGLQVQLEEDGAGCRQVVCGNNKSSKTFLDHHEVLWPSEVAKDSSNMLLQFAIMSQVR